MVIPYVSAVPILDASTRFLTEGKDYMDSTQEISLSLMALGSSYSIAENLTKENITLFVEELLERQNSDGGWGYYEGSISNVVDTSYAVIALKRVIDLYYPNENIYRKISKALENGLNFISKSHTLNGWGYIPNTLPEFYPTVMALWALGENGYTEKSRHVNEAIAYLESAESMEISEAKAVGLKILAYKSVGHQVPESLIEKAWGLVNSDNITIDERALLTYVLTTYEGLTFEVAKLLSRLEDLAESNETLIYWANAPDEWTNREVFAASAFAVMSFATANTLGGVGGIISIEDSCSALEKVQNPDGGWGYRAGYSSDDRTTYYVLKALKRCYFKDEVIEKGLEWVETRIPENMEKVSKERRLNSAYIYNLLTLLEFNMLNETEKQTHISFIKSLGEDGKWNTILGPQPYETALAIKALLALGVDPSDEDIVKAKEWLLSRPTDGWGLRIQVAIPFRVRYIMSTVPTTLEVLEALTPLVTKEEVERHLTWLMEQKIEDDGWPVVKEIYIRDILMYLGAPSVELTIRATKVLYDFGIDYHAETLNWLLDHRSDSLWGTTLTESALAVLFFSEMGEVVIKPLSLYQVLKQIPEKNFTILYTSNYNSTAVSLGEALSEVFEKSFEIKPFEGFGDSNYIVVSDFNTFNIPQYNPYIKVKSDDMHVYLGDKSYPINNTVILIPGKTSEGYLLFVLSSRGAEDIASTFLSSTIIKYLNGAACVVTHEDKNHNGVVEFDELNIELVG
ncbi:putative squalene-hopene cyclase [Thermococcus sibiricus MM 739]|uniref:Putative squalene-hopene cyclase n=2 Tax=Thermococcus sibiricus TaxID=172049 RepID=C6A0G0_THESM|nr:putative squalene-hopene cyclase [Thermococcus sibiricus MM 739]